MTDEKKREIILKAQVNFKRVPSQIDGNKRGGGITRRRYIRRESSQKEHVFVTDHIVNKMG